MGFCKDCKHYEKGFDGKPGICLFLKVADVWNGYDKLKEDGVGYSDETYEDETSVLFVGELFGCIKFEQ